MPLQLLKFFKHASDIAHNLFFGRKILIFNTSKQTSESDLVFVITGLDEAILGSMNVKDPEQNSAKIASLLQNGAHAIAPDESNVKASEEFANENIDDILAQRTEKRQIGSRAGNTFSTAQFAVDETNVSTFHHSSSPLLTFPSKPASIWICPFISVEKYLI